LRKTIHKESGICTVSYLMPVELVVLVRFYYYADKEEVAHSTSSEVIHWLVHKGLIKEVVGSEPTSTCYDITQKGRVHIRSLCAVPLPEQKWVPAVPYEFREGEENGD